MSSKMLEATCDEAGIVKVGEIIVTDADILSEGKQASEGILLIEQDKAKYLTSSATDIESTIEKTVAVIDDLTNAINQIVSILTNIGAGMTGVTTAPPPTLSTDLSQLSEKVTTLNETKDDLNTLKGALK